jgi:hypothetical protein
MNDDNPKLFTLAIKTIITHTVSYVFMGILASTFLHYAEQFTRPYMFGWMRQVNDPMVMAGPLFQPIRGLLFALVLYPLRETVFGKKNGWLIMWWTLVGLGILSTFGPAPGSVEGMVYTLIPISDQLTGWLEVVPQALLLSAILWYWIAHPEKKWLNWVLGIAFFFSLVLPILGLLMTRP